MIIGDKIAPSGIQAVVTSVNFAVLYQDRGELDKAEGYYLKALRKEERRFPRSSLLVQTLSDLAVLFDQKGDLTKAETYHRRALRVAMKLAPGSLTVADVLSNLAECVLQRGDLRHAEQFHKQSLLMRPWIEQKIKLYTWGAWNFRNHIHRVTAITAPLCHCLVRCVLEAL